MAGTIAPITVPPRSRRGRPSGRARRTAPAEAPAPSDGWDADVIALTGDSARWIRVWRAPHHWLQSEDAPGTEGILAEQLQDTGGAGPAPAREAPTVREIVVVGDGGAAEAIGRHLVGRPGVSLVLGRDPSHPAERPAEWQTALLAERRRGRRPARWSDAQPDDAWRPGAVVVVATAGIEPDRVLLHRLVRRGADHLVVRVHRGVAQVGPWVTPGLTACLECQDHWLAAHDAGYAAVLNELEQRESVVDESTLAWAAAVAARHLTSADAGRLGLAGHVQVSDPLFPTLRGFAVAPHPSCRCGAPGQAASTI